MSPSWGAALLTVFTTERSAWGKAPIATVYACVAVVVPFVTFITKGYVPVAVGVPPIEMVEAVDVPRTKPVGSVPEATVHVNGHRRTGRGQGLRVRNGYVPPGNDAGRMASVGAISVNVTVHVVLAPKLPPHPEAEVATVYPIEVVVAVTAKVSLTLSTKDAVPLPVVVALDVASVASLPLWSRSPRSEPDDRDAERARRTAAAAIAGAPLVATVMVELAELLPEFGSVEDEDSPATAVFVTAVPADAETVAAIWRVAVELALMSPIVQLPVEEA